MVKKFLLARCDRATQNKNFLEREEQEHSTFASDSLCVGKLHENV